MFDVVLQPVICAKQLCLLGLQRTWGTAFSRGKLKDKRMIEVQVLFRIWLKTRSDQHFGGCIHFDNTGMLCLSLDDWGDKDCAQKLVGLARRRP